jgi:hypothetical protein
VNETRFILVSRSSQLIRDRKRTVPRRRILFPRRGIQRISPKHQRIDVSEHSLRRHQASHCRAQSTVIGADLRRKVLEQSMTSRAIRDLKCLVRAIQAEQHVHQIRIRLWVADDE